MRARKQNIFFGKALRLLACFAAFNVFVCFDFFLCLLLLFLAPPTPPPPECHFLHLYFTLGCFIHVCNVCMPYATFACCNVGCYFRNQKNWNFFWLNDALVLSREIFHWFHTLSPAPVSFYFISV